MPIELAKIEELAPDQASLSAAAKLKKPGPWSLLGCDDAAGLIWGECQGSGSSPYRVICSEADYGYKCTCPSRKFPCKHSLALLWMRADRVAFKSGPIPDWVGDWLARRRPGATALKQAAATEKTKASAANVEAAEPAVDDPKAAARAAAQRERNRAEREAAILAGLDELDTWITDALQAGLASFMPAAGERCRKIVQRLVDAKAPGLANMVERLPADVLAAPEPSRTDRLIERLAQLHLVSSAYRRQDRLTEPVKADIRQLVGWPVTREALLADPDVLRVRDRWMVVSTVVEVQADKLRRTETWLSRLGEGTPRFAVLIDFTPVSVGKVGATYSTGEVFEAELAYFRSPAPLRAVIAEQTGPTIAGGRWPAPPDDVAAAVAGLSETLAARPWSGDMPFAAHSARIVASGASLWLTDATGATGLPVRADEDDLALPLTGLDGIDVFGRWDGHLLSLGLAETPLGRWTAS
jgi:SWIM zinc finger